MKALINIVIVFGFIFLATGCDKPSPTELISEETQGEGLIDIEVISKDFDNEWYSTGYDSTGIVLPLQRFSSVVNISGIKTTFEMETRKISSAQAIFFDRQLPIFAAGGRLIGYRTRRAGSVFFDNIQAREVPYFIRYRDLTGIKDTLLGIKHILFGGRNNQQDQFVFPYNASIDFRLAIAQSPGFTFSIPTPTEITGNVKFRISDKGLPIYILEWNSEKKPLVELVIGGKIASHGKIIPFYRLRVRDTGTFRIPPELLRSLPLNRIEHFVFSFIRKNEFHRPAPLGELYIVSQSIHNIFADIP